MAILPSTGRDSRGGYLWPVLTDYHLHLRPDEVGSAEEYFTQENVERYLAAAEEQGIAELGVSEHVYRFKEALELWQHPYWSGQAKDDLAADLFGDPLEIWRRWAGDVDGRQLDAGHHMAEEIPEELAGALRSFMVTT